MVPAARLERVRSCLQGILSFETRSEVTGTERKILEAKGPCFLEFFMIPSPKIRKSQ